MKPKPVQGCEAGVRLDAIDVHSYTTGGPTHEGRPNDVQMGDLAKMLGYTVGVWHRWRSAELRSEIARYQADDGR